MKAMDWTNHLGRWRIASSILIIISGILNPLPTRAGEKEKPETVVAVQAGAIQRRTLRRYVTAYGQVGLEPARPGTPAALARISSPLAGLVLEVSAVTGQMVREGQTLVRLDDRLAQAAMKKAQAALRLAETEFGREEQLRQLDNTSQKRFEEAAGQLAVARAALAEAQTQLDYLAIKAPFAGTVTLLQVHPGETIDVSTPVVEIADLRRLTAIARVPGSELNSVRPNQPATISAGRYNYSGRVIFISPRVEEETGAAFVYLSLPEDGALLPGQFIKAVIAVEERTNRLAVPRESLMRRPDGKSAIALIRGAIATPREVRTGLEDGDWVEVEGEGLAAGGRVVTVGAYGLPGETRVRVTNR